MLTISCLTWDFVEFVNHTHTFRHFFVSNDANKSAGLGLELLTGLPDV